MNVFVNFEQFKECDEEFHNCLFMKMIKAIKIKNIIFVPLIGMMLGKIIGSITTFFAYKYDLVQNISSWMEGDMSLIMKGSYELYVYQQLS